MDKDTELEFLKNFARLDCRAEQDRGYVYVTGTATDQLRCLWTAFCIHHDLSVDTREYDDLLSQLWKHVDTHTGDWDKFAEFESFMCYFLV